ncbi:MAG: hypothetical protein KKD17_04650 [Nanoarchaeota archaeon]|nr:hypothetical protein [Nanoarchaeota archaeon]
MAGFDSNLDKEIWAEKAQVAENMSLKVSVMSYNDGLPKLQISRERTNKDGQPGFAKLGRMTLDEVKAVMPLMEKAKEHLHSTE